MLEIANVRLINLKKSITLWTHSKWVMVVDGSDGSRLATSEEFRPTKEPESGKMIKRPGDREQLILESLVNQMIVDGWSVVRSGKPDWWSATLARGDRDEVDRIRSHFALQSLQDTPSQSQHSSITRMWMITLGVIILMFAICIVLAFSVQLEIRPG